MRHALRTVAKDPWWHSVGLSFGLLFVGLLAVARLYPTELNGADGAVEAFIRPYQTLLSVEFFLAVTVLGTVIGITIIAMGAAWFLRKNRFNVLQLFLLLVFASLSMGIAKTYVARVRPDALLWLDPLNTYSFPSGHATLSTAFYGFLCVMIYRRTQGFVRWASIAILILLIFLICLSRIVLSYHYATDVLGGIFLGLFWIAVIFMLPRTR